MSTCFWTNMVRCREDCTPPVPPPVMNILALGAPSDPAPTVAYPTTSDTDINGDYYVGAVDVSASIGPGQPAIVAAIPTDGLLRPPPPNFCSFCGIGDEYGTPRLRIKAPASTPAWVTNEVTLVAGTIYNVPFDITHITLKDGSGSVVADTDTGNTFQMGLPATVDMSGDPWIFTLQGLDWYTLLNMAAGWTDFSGGSIELTLSYDGNTSSGTPLQLEGIDLVNGIQCQC
jgi:hypothetical protein